MGAYVFMFFFAMPGPIIPLINTEGMLLLQTLKEGRDPMMMVLAASAGHMCTYLILYTLGEKTLMKWSFLARKLQALTEEQREKFRKSTTAGFIVGGLLGVPPVFVLAPLSSSLNYPRLAMAIITFLGRVVRFSILVFAGAEVRAWFGL